MLKSLIESDWYKVSFTDEQIENAKKLRKEKDKCINYRELESEYRWAGDLAEDAFIQFLTEYQINEWQAWSKIGHVDTRDFTVGRLEIDIKARTGNKHPQPYFNCPIEDRQLYSKFHEIVNTFVFSYFWIPENTIFIFGFLEKDDFLRKSRGYKKDDKPNKRVNFVFSVDTHVIKIRDLKPIIDLPRYT